MALQRYLNEVAFNIDQENGTKLAGLLSIRRRTRDFNPASQGDFNRLHFTIDQHLATRAPWNDIIAHHLSVLAYIDAGNYSEAYESQKSLVKAFSDILPSLTRWCLRPLYVINDDLRVIATKADDGTAVSESLEDAANVIRKSFSYCVTDRGILSTTKKHGAYYMTGLLFRIYFKLRKQNLCKNVLRALENAGLPSLDNYPKSDRVTYRFYLGRLYFLEEDYKRAEEELSLAFQECTDLHHKNKTMILQTLLPLKMTSGILPSAKLLAKFEGVKKVYGGLVEATRRGNVKAFDEALVQSEGELTRQGTYFAVERARSVVVRQLFYKVYLILGRNPKIPMSMFKRALEFSGMNIEMEDTEWLLANMIYKNYMKGYLSHEKSFVVLSKDGAFPPLSNSQLTPPA